MKQHYFVVYGKTESLPLYKSACAEVGLTYHAASGKEFFDSYLLMTDEQFDKFNALTDGQGIGTRIVPQAQINKVLA